MKRPSFALLALFIAFAALGALVGLGLNGKLNGLIGFFSSDVVIYQDSTRLNETQQYQVLSWDALLPEAEKVLLGKAQSTQSSQQNLPLHEQVFQSIQRTFDDEYQQALISVNTVDKFNGNYVELSGFIVPVEANAQREITSFFIVPYFGACIHYPPPPPNQIVFVSLNNTHEQGGISGIDIQQAYTFSGEFSTGLYEDPQGTSAYLLDVIEIKPYSGLGNGINNGQTESKNGAFHIESDIR
ncbi:DUF3299 domain-containing protein [Alteromonas sp. S005]|uniref:DUF3299 domain-containing protein n=1 Tax=Alteromonas sp. S005 TaxID=3117400 RepID=UPI002FE31D2C